ncbi:MAG: hypothetical protein JO270_16800 [Acidobacteriaceae bacterium]|nr:hypothetical protein [Acidobacteriaceae bacterium]MBV8573035.1 hypothetical protein [Acidobacteriaceae bacterium]
MTTLSRRLAVVSFSLTLLTGATVSLAAAQPGWFQEYAPAGPDYPAPYGGGLRSLVDRTQNDLRLAAQEEHLKGDQRERYEHAQGHLSSFDRHLTKGRFDKGELDKSIDSIKAILDKNVLQASSRDALLRDVDGLRAARDHRY